MTIDLVELTRGMLVHSREASLGAAALALASGWATWRVVRSARGRAERAEGAGDVQTSPTTTTLRARTPRTARPAITKLAAQGATPQEIARRIRMPYDAVTMLVDGDGAARTARQSSPRPAKAAVR